MFRATFAITIPFILQTLIYTNPFLKFLKVRKLFSKSFCVIPLQTLIYRLAYIKKRLLRDGLFNILCMIFRYQNFVPHSVQKKASGSSTASVPQLGQSFLALGAGVPHLAQNLSRSFKVLPQVVQMIPDFCSHAG